uniref:Uncharacterized protein n=1 Tax=Solanum tuberosum TaxID=4113 RepID=M1DLV8_SOLTU
MKGLHPLGLPVQCSLSQDTLVTQEENALSLPIQACAVIIHDPGLRDREWGHAPSCRSVGGGLKLLKLSLDSRTLPTRLGTGPEWDHRTGTNRNRTGTGRFDRVVDRYRDEPDRNYRDGGSVPSRPTIYRDRTGTDRNGPERNGMG